MIYHYMKEKHNPPVSYGDCLRACVASILEVERMEAVPHFTGDGCEDDDQLRARITSFALTRGAVPFGLSYAGELPLGELLEMMAINNPNINVILFGSTDDNEPHAVIARNGKIIHDPSPWPGGVVGPTDAGYWHIMVFVSSVLIND